MSSVRVFLLLYVVSVAFMYYLSYFKKIPVFIPGDLFIKKGQRTIYFPFSSALLLSIMLFVALNILF